MAAKQEAAWDNPSATLRDSVLSRNTLPRVSRRPDSAVSHSIFVIADVRGPSHYHLGDEAMLEANLTALRDLVPGIHFILLSGDPEWSARRYGVAALPFPSTTSSEAGIRLQQLASAANRFLLCEETLGPEICRAIQESDALIISGGGNLCSTWPDKILERVAAIEVALHFALPVVLLGQTLGPWLKREERVVLEACLAQCQWVGLREEDSAVIAAQLGVSAERIQRQADDAFFLPACAVEDERAYFLGRDEKPLIVVCLDASFQAEPRKSALSALATQLDGIASHLDAQLVFLPNVGGDDAGNELSDEQTGRELKLRLRSDLITLSRWEPGEARWLIEQSRLVISTRYHPVVFATACAVPSLAIYSDEYTRVKLRGALRPGNLECWCISLAEAERGSLLPVLMELYHQRDDISERMRRQVDRALASEPERWRSICASLKLPINQVSPEASSPSHSTTSTIPAKRKSELMSQIITEDQWQQYQKVGYLRLGKLLSDAELSLLQRRLDDIMLGAVVYPTVQMQLDTGGKYEELPDPVAQHLGRTLRYRKLQGLEADPDILAFIRRDLFREICAWHYGRHASVSIFRVMMMNKPAEQGTYLPWHQDAGDVWKLDRDPMVTTWIALDPATKANGCVQIIPGTHRLGLLSKNGSNISPEHEAMYCPPEQIEYLELEPGEGLLLHNWLLHRSETNKTAIPRRALSVCYMDGRTMSVLTGSRFPVVFGEPEDTESAMPFFRNLKAENQQLREMATESQKYAQSLLDENQRRIEMQREAETYVSSLVADNQRREEMRREAETYARSLEAELFHLRGESATV